jgi:hypothetical protein
MNSAAAKIALNVLPSRFVKDASGNTSLRRNSSRFS